MLITPPMHRLRALFADNWIQSGRTGFDARASVRESKHERTASCDAVRSRSAPAGLEDPQFTIALTMDVTAAAVGGVTQNIRAPVPWLAAQSASLAHPTGWHAPLTHTNPVNFPSPAPDGLQS